MKLNVLIGAALALVLLSLPAYAQTAVSVPAGDWLSAIQPYVNTLLEAVLGVVGTIVLAHLPASLKAFVTQAMINQVEQLLAQAINYGLNTVAGAEKGKKLDVNVGNAVVAQALQYAIDHGPGYLIAWMGGADSIVEKIVARLDLLGGAQGSVQPGTPLAATPAAAPAPAAAS